MAGQAQLMVVCGGSGWGEGAGGEVEGEGLCRRSMGRGRYAGGRSVADAMDGVEQSCR